jgi:hypothetical protein
MKTYRVISLITGADITNDLDWVLFPNGDLRYINYDYCTIEEDRCAKAVFDIEESSKE